jgi:hypothetical protein
MSIMIHWHPGLVRVVVPAAALHIRTAVYPLWLTLVLSLLCLGV